VVAVRAKFADEIGRVEHIETTIVVVFTILHVLEIGISDEAEIPIMVGFPMNTHAESCDGDGRSWNQ
jgi:hypothetical protein